MFGYRPIIDESLPAIVKRLKKDAFKPVNRLKKGAFAPENRRETCFSEEAHCVKVKHRIAHRAGNFGSDEVAPYNTFMGELEELLDALVPALKAAVEEMPTILSSHERKAPNDVEAIAVVTKDIPFF